MHVMFRLLVFFLSIVDIFARSSDHIVSSICGKPLAVLLINSITVTFFCVLLGSEDV